MSSEQYGGCWVLVVFPCLEPQHPVLHHVGASNSVPSPKLVELLDELYWLHVLAIYRSWRAFLECYGYFLYTCIPRGVRCPAVYLLWGGAPWLLQHPTLYGARPQVLINAPWLLLCSWNWDCVLSGIIYLPLSGKVQLAHGSHHR